VDWTALRLSLLLAVATALVLLPLGIAAGRWLALTRRASKPLFEAMVALPLVLPPTVLGFYLLLALGGHSPLGALVQRLGGQPLVFSFEGLLLASVVANIPFALLPMQRAFESIPAELHDAARTCGLSPWQALWRVELPLAWPGIVTGMVMTVAHTMGEFGVVLMVGGSIPGETRTVAIAIYDRVQAFDLQGAGQMSATLLALSMAALATTAWLARRSGVPRHDHPGPSGPGG
jgi:molybdate transport system permease protein